MIVGANGNAVEKNRDHDDIVEPIAIGNPYHQPAQPALIVEQVQGLVNFVVKDQPVHKELSISKPVINRIVP